MPLDKEKHFLSSLLLVHYTEFVPDGNISEVPRTKEQLDREWIPDLDTHHILEIASVARL